jgi:hypothetical protein
MKLKPALLLIIVLGCFSAGASIAQDKAAQAKRSAPQASFASLDDDGDRAISRTEAAERTQLLVDFDRIDLDRDDKLEPAEYASFYAAGYRASK